MAAPPAAGGHAPAVPGRIPALDGLRGLALVGILLFHADLAPGGFLSVDTFFALSGFLITGLLLREHAGSGTVRLRSFWARRARRLLPGLVLLLAGIAAYAWWFAPPGDGPRIRAASIGTAAYVANWQAIAAGQGYWDRFLTPSPLGHAWTLAVEEQFYLVWPLVALAVLRAGTGRVGPLLATCLVGAAGSAAAMALLYEPGAEPSRVYLGTDTRAAALLLGAALACREATARRPGRPGGGSGGPARQVGLDVAAGASLAGLLLAWATVDGLAAPLYRGGFLLLCLPVLVLIRAAVSPVPGLVARALAWAPLRLLGTVSYGAYLWHWPAFIVVRSHVPDLAPWPRFALQLAATAPLAVGSYLLVERPIHRRGLAALPHPSLAPVAVVVTAVLLLGATAGPGDPAGSDVRRAAPGVLAPLPTAETGSSSPGTAPPGSAPGRPAPARPRRVLVVGDSLGWFLGQELADHGDRYGVVAANRAIPNCFLDRGTGRVRYQGAIVEQEPDICRTWPQRWADDVAAFAPDVVLVVFGNLGNGDREVDGAWAAPCSDRFGRWFGGELAEAARVLGARGAAVAVTTVPYPRFPFLPRSLDAATDCMNRTIATTFTRTGSARVVDLGGWVCPAADRCVREVGGVNLRPDGVHFEGEGAALAAAWVLDQVGVP